MKNDGRSRWTLFMVVVFLAGFPALVYSKDEGKSAAPVIEKKMSEAERNQTAANIQELKQLEIRILVLQQMVNEQVAVLQ